MRDFLTDKEVAALLEVNTATISRVFKHPDKYPNSAWMKKCVIYSGHSRRWDVKKLSQYSGVGIERLENFI